MYVSCCKIKKTLHLLQPPPTGLNAQIETENSRRTCTAVSVKMQFSVVLASQEARSRAISLHSREARGECTLGRPGESALLGGKGRVHSQVPEKSALSGSRGACTLGGTWGSALARSQGRVRSQVTRERTLFGGQRRVHSWVAKYSAILGGQVRVHYWGSR